MSEKLSVQRQIICVLGMHRSGTSMIARIMNLLGVHLGPEQYLMKPQEDNPQGFWENEKIKEINDEILSRFGGCWHEPPVFPGGWENSPDLADIRQRVRNLIDEDFPAAKVWGWKDPRACLTLPFWQKLLPPMRYVICLRNPLDVARSLDERENFSLPKSIDLWLTHVQSSLNHTANQPKMLMFFEDVVHEPSVEVDRLRRFLGGRANRMSSDAHHKIQQFIDKGLQHHRAPLIELVDDPRVSFPAKALYMALRLYVRPNRRQSAVDGAQEPLTVLDNFSRYALDAYLENRDKVARVAEMEEVAKESHRRLEEISNDRNQLAEETSRLTHELSLSRNQAEKLAQDLLVVRRALADEKAKSSHAAERIAGVETALAEATSRTGGLEAELAKATAKVGGLAAELKEAASKAGEFEAELTQANVRLGFLDAQLAEAMSKAGGLGTGLTQANERIRVLENELSQANKDIVLLQKFLREERSKAERLAADADRIMSEKDSALADLRQRFDAELLERDRTIESLRLAQSGIFWELLIAYRRAKDRSLPPGTKRRAMYDQGLKLLKGSGNNSGISELGSLMLRHPIRSLRNANRANINKFFYYFRHSSPAVVSAKLERKLGLDQPPPPRVDRQSQKFGLIISGCPGDAFRYRCEHHAEQLRFLGLTVDIVYYDQVDYRSILQNYDCFWLHRVPHTAILEEFIASAHVMSKPIIFDTDDLVFDEEKIPYIRALQWMSPDEMDLYYDGVRRYHRTLSLCRFATVTTEPLRDAIRRLFPQIHCQVNPNVLSDAQIAQAEEALQRNGPAEDKHIVRIAYFSGTRTHNIDFQECAGALTRILDSYPEVKLMLVGHLDVADEFERFGARIERYPLVPWQELPRMLRSVDINLAPLELDNPFTESKSALKYFEAAVMGVPTVASDVKAYQTAIRHGENGFLCKTSEDWVRRLSRLVEDKELRCEMGRRARTETLENLTTRRQASQFKNVLAEILKATRVRSEKSLSIAFVLRAPIAQVGGGYKVIFRLAHDLANRGHDVHLYVEAIAHLEGKTATEIIDFCRFFFGESAAQIHVGHDMIRPSDIAIATNWPTAFVVDSLMNARCKAYLIQDYEPDFYEPNDQLRNEVEKTYALPLKKICIGRYLGNLFAERDGIPVSFFDFPLDHDIFNARQRKFNGPIHVLFFARPTLKRRGYSVGVEALHKVHRQCPDVEFYFYGMEEEPELPFPCVNLGILDQRRLAQAMRDSDIHLSLSLSNISQVPFQAMACGCAVVETRVPTVEAMVQDGRHCLLAEPRADALADTLRQLIQDDALRRRIANDGFNFVQGKTWDNSCKQFEDIILDSLLITRNRVGEGILKFDAEYGSNIEAS